MGKAKLAKFDIYIKGIKKKEEEEKQHQIDLMCPFPKSTVWVLGVWWVKLLTSGSFTWEFI